LEERNHRKEDYKRKSRDPGKGTDILGINMAMYQGLRNSNEYVRLLEI